MKRSRVPKVFAISPVLKIGWRELCRQRAYIGNEVENRKGEEVEVLRGIQHLLDAVADGVYDTYPMYEKELLKIMREE